MLSEKLYRYLLPAYSMKNWLGFLLPIVWVLAMPFISSAEIKTLEDRSHVTIMEFSGLYDLQPADGFEQEFEIRSAIAKEFYRTHPDEYDFLVIYTGFDFDLGMSANGKHRARGRYYAVKNDVEGIGLGRFDSSVLMGSSGRLQGFIDMGSLSDKVTDPTDAMFEETLSTLAHEMLHRWGVNVRFRDFSGNPSTSLLSDVDDKHWNFLLHTENSVMYGNDWLDNGDGTFTSVGRKRSKYSPLDLYLMGMIDKSQVPPFFLIESPDIDPDRLPEDGVTISGQKKIISIDDIIAVEGERSPSANDSQKAFKMAFIYLVPPGHVVDDAKLIALNNIRDAWAVRYIIATDGHSTVEVYPESKLASLPPVPEQSGPRSAPFDLNEGLSWILAKQNVDGSWGDTSATYVRDTVEVLKLLQTFELGTSTEAFREAIQWLNNHKGDLGVNSNVDYMSRIASVLGGSCEQILSLKLTGGQSAGWGAAPGFESNSLDTILALKALPPSCTGKTDLFYLLDRQSPDGSWGLTEKKGGSIQVTSDVVGILKRGGYSGLTEAETVRVNSATSRGLYWLSSKQNRDGGFGTSPSTVYDTAKAVTLLRGIQYGVDFTLADEYLQRSQLADGSWNGNVWQTAMAVNALRNALLPNLSVSSQTILFSESQPVEGEIVTLSAKVSNSGTVDANNIIVRFYDGDRDSGGSQIDSDKVISTLSAQSSEALQAMFETAGKTGAHQIYVYIDPERSVSESSESDNIATKALTVGVPSLEPDIQLRGTDISVNPGSIQTLPQEISLTASLVNRGQTDLIGVKVWVYDGDPASGGVKIAEQIIDIPGRSTVQAVFPLIFNAGGMHHLVLVADPLNEVSEISKGNNSAYVNVSQVSNIDIDLLGSPVAFSQNPVSIGQDVTISVNVVNRGTIDAYSVPLRYLIQDTGGDIEIATRTITVPAGGSVIDSFTWRTDRVLDRAVITVHADPLNAVQEAVESNNRASSTLTVLGSTLPNLATSYRDISFSQPQAMQNGQSEVMVIVRNTGFAPVVDVPAALYSGMPDHGGVLIGTITIPLLNPGESTRVSMPWQNIPDYGDKLIIFRLDPDNIVMEFDEDDNEAFGVLKVASLPDLDIFPGAIAFSPAYPKDGDQVVVTATVANNGDQDALDVVVRAYEGDPLNGGVQIGEDHTVARLSGKAVANIQFAYSTQGRSGLNTVFIQADPGGTVAELREDNNTASRTLGVQNASLWVTNPYFSPNGDGVKDSTVLFSRIAASGVVVTDKDNNIVRRFGGIPVEGGSLEWDGLDDSGRLAPDGQYMFTLTSEGGAALAAIMAAVDNNNSPLFEALGTKYLIEKNITSPFSREPYAKDSYKFVEWLPDDKGMVVLSDDPVDYGFLLVRLDGEVVRLSPRERSLRPSWKPSDMDILGYTILPGGGAVRVLLRGNSAGTSYDIYETWDVYTDGTGARKLATIDLDVELASSSPNYWNSTYTPEFSPDGSRFFIQDELYDNRNGQAERTRGITVVNADGSGSRRVAAHDNNWNYIWSDEGTRWSEDGSKILYIVGEYYSAPLRSGCVECSYATGLWAVNADGTGNHRVIAIVASDWQAFTNPPLERAAFLDNGKIALYACVYEEEPYVYDSNLQPAPAAPGCSPWLVDLNGGAHERLGYNIGYPSSFYYSGSDNFSYILPSPDGRHAAASFRSVGSSYGDRTQIVFNSDGEEELRQQGSEGGFLNWNKAGQVSFIEWSTNGFKVFDVNTRSVKSLPVGNDSNRIELVDGALSADGKYILFCGGVDWLSRKNNILDVSSGRFTEVPSAGCFDRNPYHWSMGSAGRVYRDAMPGFDFDLSSDKALKYKAVQAINNNAKYADFYSLSSGLNLLADLKAQRGSAEFVLTGTASDANFEGYELEYAEAGSPDIWRRIGAPSPAVVLNGEFGRWAPPSEGLYYVRLTARDKAGNNVRSVKAISWSASQGIASLYAAPAVISPNGDGAQDSAAVNYTVLSPGHFDFTVYSPDGASVRTISKDSLVIGPDSVIWDGRDDGGRVLPDGVYRISVSGYETYVEVDSTPPSVAIGIVDPYETINMAEEISYRNGWQPDTLVPNPVGTLTGYAHDGNIVEWRIEYGEGDNPSEWFEFKTGQEPVYASAQDGTGTVLAQIGRRGILLSESLYSKIYSQDRTGERDGARNVGLELKAGRFVEHLRDSFVNGDTRLSFISGKKFRISARDTAGNVSAAVSGFALDRIVAYEWDGKAMTAANVIAAGGVHTVTFDYAVHEPIEGLELQYRVAGDIDWVARAIPAGEKSIAWDTSALPSNVVHEARVAGRGLSGDVYYSNTFMAERYEAVKFTGYVDVDQGNPIIYATVRAFVDDPIEDIKLFADTPGGTFEIGADWRFSGTLETDKDFAAAVKFDSIISTLCSQVDPKDAVDVYDYKILARNPRGYDFNTYLKAGEETPYQNIADGHYLGNTVFPYFVLYGKSGTTYVARAAADQGITNRLSCTQITRGVETLPLSIEYAESQACGAVSDTVIIDGKEGLLPSRLSAFTRKVYISDQPGGELKLFTTAEPLSPITVYTGGMAEGSYAVRVEGYAPDGSLFAAGSGVFLVDHTLPAAEISSPADNGAVCAVQRTDANGRTILTVPVSGVADDKNFGRYVLEYREADSSDWVQFFPSPGLNGGTEDRQPVRGFLADWDVTNLRGGTYTVRIKVWDKTGNLKCSTITVVVDRAGVQGFSSDLRLISPNGDGVSDSAALRYSVVKPMGISAHAYRLNMGQDGKYVPDAAPVRTIHSWVQVLAGSNSFVWDGRDDAGAAVVDSLYTVALTGADACGNSNRQFKDIEVDNTPPFAEITSPAPSDVLPVMVSVTGRAEDLHFAGYVFEVGQGESPASWSILSENSGLVAGGFLGKWNTSGLLGPYTLRLTAVDQAGNRTVFTRTYALPPSSSVIGNLDVQPPVFSPNGDGNQDGAAVNYSLNGPARVQLDIVNSKQTLVKRLVESLEVQAGGYAVTWDGTDSLGGRVADGDYKAVLTDLSSSGQVTEVFAVSVDTLPPAVAVSTPVDEVWMSGDVIVSGSVRDSRLSGYQVSWGIGANPAAFTILDAGGQDRVDYPFGSLKGLAEGPYTLKIYAADQAGNSVESLVSFTIDNIVPKVSLQAPAEGGLYASTLGTVRFEGVVEEVNLQEYAIRYRPAATPGIWSTIVTGVSLPSRPLLYDWQPGAVPDGLYVVSLLAKDRAGLTGETQVNINIDNTPPAVDIISPSDGGYLTGPADIIGTVADENLKDYTVEVSEGEPATAFKWSALGNGVQQVANGALAVFMALPPDGAYTIRVTAADRAGLKTERKIAFKVKTKPPMGPLNLSAAVENKSNVRLGWEASQGAGGYNIYRNGAKINTVSITGTGYIDQNLNTGTYVYTVTAVDTPLESVHSGEVRADIDVTPPYARISSPFANGFVSGLTGVRGIAAPSPGQDDFKEYRLYAGQGVAPSAWTLLRRSSTPVGSGELSAWDTSALPENSVYTLKIEAEDINGNTGSDTVSVTVVNAPPAAPVLISALTGGSSVTLTWQANTEPHIAGYQLFIDDEFTHRIVVGTTYTDVNLADGSHTYYIKAIDRAGSVSAPSNILTAVLETHAPKATIVEPANQTRTDKPVTVSATVTDRDVARVQFQYKISTAYAWTNLGAPVAAAPYQVTWNPVGLAYGYYNFRAVATDTSNNTDSAPAYITIQHANITPPAQPTGLVAVVTEGTTALTWAASTEADRSGYFVYRAIGQGTPVKLTATRITATAYNDINLADGYYTYTVTAVDTAGNESGQSISVNAHIYALSVTSPAACVSTPSISLNGSGAEQGSAVTVYVDAGQGALASGTTQAGTDGTFRFDAVGLSVGDNILTLQALDSSGNLSKKYSVTVRHSLVPLSPPSGFLAEVNGYDVTLSWDSTADSAVIGHNLYRNGSPLMPPVNVAGSGVVSASSTLYATTPPGKAVDGNLNSYWVPASSDTAPWLIADFGQQILVKEIEVNWYASSVYYRARDFSVQAWDGLSWVTLKAFQNNTLAKNVVTLQAPAKASRIRIYITRQGTSGTYLSEIKISKYGTTATSFLNSGLADGRYAFEVKAISGCGVEGPAAEAVAVVGDVIAPAAPVNLFASVTGRDVALQWDASTEADLAGYKLYRDNGAGAWFRINNNLFTDTATTDRSLLNGGYLYRVTAVDMVGNESLPSNEATVSVDVPLLQAPQLSLDALASGGVLELAWSANNGSTLIAGYRLYRSTNAGGPYEPVQQALITDTTYRDVAVTNGTLYYYIVRVLDSVGNLSSPSNEVSGVPLPPPVSQLTVRATGAGGALDVAWTPLPSNYMISGYNIYRSTVSGGTYILVNLSPITEAAGYRDTGLADGVTYYYVVKAVDGQGNESGQSNEASGTPYTDAAAPQPPVINSPTDASNPITSATATVTVTGFTDADAATVRLFIGGEQYGTTDVTHSSTITSDTFTLSAVPYGRVVFSANKNIMAYFIQPAGGSGQMLVITNVSSRQTRYFNSDGDNYDLVFSPDGTRLAYTTWLDDPNGGYEVLNILNLDTGAVEWTGNGSAYGLSYSPDGATAAYTSYTYSDTGSFAEVGLLDFVSGSSTIVSGRGDWAGAQAWSPDGAKLAYTLYANSNSQIWIMDMNTGVSTQLTSVTDNAYRPLWSPDGTKLAYILNDTQIWTRDMNTGLSTQHASATGYKNNFVWSPDGSKMAYTDYDPAVYTTSLLLTGVADMVTTVISPSVWGKFLFSPDANKIAFDVENARNGCSTWLYDIASGSKIEAMPRSVYCQNKAFSQDGRALVYHEAMRNWSTGLTTFNIHLLWTATGQTVPLGQDVGYGEFFWDNSVLYYPSDNGNVLSIAMPSGSFQFDNVGLNPGDNVIFAVAVDRAGNVSLPSAAITVSYILPPSPEVLSLIPLNSGGALDLSWTITDPLNLVSGYNVYRGTASGGLYAKVNQSAIAGMSYQDTGLENGVTYYYVVKALDATGNEGLPSNEASGMPVDTLSAPPVITAPSNAASPVTIVSDTVDIGGTSEAGSTVTLLVNGISSGVVDVDLNGYFWFNGIRMNHGSNIISAIAIDQAGNRSQPSESVIITLDTSGWADLAITDSDVFIYPPYPRPGEPVNIYAVVRNTGSTDIQNIDVSFNARGQNGVVDRVGIVQTIPAISAGGQAFTGVTWDTTGKSGTYKIVVSVDPYDAIKEAFEDNNYIQRHIAVSADQGLVLSASTDSAVYGYGSRVFADVRLMNPDLPRDAVLDINVEDSRGYLVSNLAHNVLTQIGYGESVYPQVWSVGSTYPGDYRIRAVLTSSAGVLLTEAMAPFRVLTDMRVAAKVTTDKAGYYHYETVGISGAIDNLSVNSDLTGLTAVIDITDSRGNQQAHFESPVNMLMGSSIAVRESWRPTVPSPDTYNATLRVQSGQAVLASAGAAFRVMGLADMSGKLTLSPERTGIGHDVSAVVAVTNIGTMDIAGATIRLLMPDMRTGQGAPVELGSQQLDLLTGQSSTVSMLISTQGLSAGAYNVIVQALIPEDSTVKTKTLSSATLTVADIEAPRLTVLAPQDGIYANRDVIVSVIAVDGSSGIDKVEWSVDGGPWQLMPPSDPSVGRYAATYAASQAHEGQHTVSIRASDLAGNNDNSSSTDANPVSVSFMMDVTPPSIQITGVADGMAYRNTSVTPVITITDADAFTHSISLDGAPFVSGTAISIDGSYNLVVSATDRTGNSSTQSVSFTLSHNFTPVADAGADMTAISGDTVVLNGSGSSDPDTDALTYSWVQAAGPGVVISDLASPQPFFTAPDVTEDTVLTFVLTVADPHGANDSAAVNIMVQRRNQPPVANAGVSQSVIHWNIVILDGSNSFDPDADMITYQWNVLSVPAGSSVTGASLSDATSPMPSFTPDTTGDYVFELTVSDGRDISAPARVTVTAGLPPNVPPNADAGAGQNVIAGTIAYLNGIASDPDNGPQAMTYLWGFAGVPASSQLTDADIGNRFTPGAYFTPDTDGEYLVRFTVSDGANEASAITSVRAYANTPPVANAGADISINLGQTATLDGTGSYDPDQWPYPVNYRWSIVSRPTASLLTDADIMNADTARPSITLDAGGVYVMSLTVGDGIDTSTDNVAVTAVAPVRVSGGVYGYHNGYQEKMSLDITSVGGVVQAGGWLKYYFTQTRMNFVSTGILSMSVAGNTVTITGSGTVNGVAGYGFSSTIINGAPDVFGIRITRPDGTLHYEYSLSAAGGDLVIQ